MKWLWWWMIHNIWSSWSDFYCVQWCLPSPSSFSIWVSARPQEGGRSGIIVTCLKNTHKNKDMYDVSLFSVTIAEWFSFTFPVCGLPNNLSFGYYWLLKQIFLVVAINHDLLICVSWLVMKFTRQKPWTERTSTNSFQTHKKIPDNGSVCNENRCS